MKAYSYIRFSTPEQLKGDSLRRQLEAGEKYAHEHGLILDKSLSMQDLGLSAYHGEHKTKGALGEFLKLVEAGRIEKGSVLIVENLDRLSREKVLDDCKVERECVTLRLRLRTELQKLIDRIEIFPLRDAYTPMEEVEDGVVQVMRSKVIDRISIRFKGTHNKRILYLKSYAERV